MDQPNKSTYDPRKWLRAGQESMVQRAVEAFEDLKCYKNIINKEDQ